MLKIRGTEILQALSSLARRAVGPAAIPFVEAAFAEGGAVGAGLTLVLIGALGFAVSAVRRRRGHGRPPAGM